MMKKQTKTIKRILLVIVLIACVILVTDKVEVFNKYKDLPDYGIEILSEAKSEVNKITNKNTLSFSFITDIHINNEGNSKNNLNVFSKMTNDDLIEFGVIGGDLYSAYDTNHDQGIGYIKQVYNLLAEKNNKKLYYTKGNHDCNAKLGQSEYISNEEYYEIVLNKLEDDVVTNPLDEFGDYYYKDFEKAKIRLCVLNSFEGEGQQFIFNDKELNFIENSMLNFEEKENPDQWQVIFISHTANVEDKDKFNEVVNKFQENGGTIIAFVAGHAHIDDYNYDDGYLSIIVQRGFNTPEEKNTEDEICFSVFTIDTDKKILYETRCGRGENRQWNYAQENTEILKEAA